MSIKELKKLWPQAVWIAGKGNYAVLAHCSVLTVTLWPTMAEAEQSKDSIDRFACGHACNGNHEIKFIGADQ